MKDKAFHMTMLFDFYGDLLTDRQKEFFDLYYNEDLSLAEIAENAGITRQGVRDVVARFLEMQKISAEIENAAAQIQTINAERYQSTDLMELAQKIGKYAEMLKE